MERDEDGIGSELEHAGAIVDAVDELDFDRIVDTAEPLETGDDDVIDDEEIDDEEEVDEFAATLATMPGVDETGTRDPFLRVAYGRKLLDYRQERELGRRLGDARVEMTEALGSFAACIAHLDRAWREAVVHVRSPGEVLQWPSGAPTRAGDDDASGNDGARKRMATLSLRHECWRNECRERGETPLETPLDLRALFVDAAPAFRMLCELTPVARASLERAGPRARGRTALEKALERALAAEMRFQDARRIMLESNLRLVFSIAGKFVNNGIGYDDLVQEGSIGLLRAIEKFEPALGFKFSTYASTWIWQAVTRAIANQRRTVRVPAHIHDKMIRVRSISASIEQKTGRAPDVVELAEASGMTPEVVTRAMHAANRSLSLDAPVRAGEETSFVELTPDHEQPDTVDQVQDRELRRIVRDAVSELPQRESVIVSLRLGLDGTEMRTLEEIGAILGITRERTRQIQNRAFATLRERLKDVGAALI